MTGLDFEPCELPQDAVLVAHVGDAWGVKGGLKLVPYSADPQALFSSKRWYFVVKQALGGRRLKPPHPSSQATALALALPERFMARVRSVKQQTDTVVAFLHGIDNRDSAQSLKGYQIYIPRSSFPTPSDDEYYWVDLLGLSVYNREGLALGTVTDLLSAGPQTTLVIRPSSDASQANPKQARLKEILIPFVSRYVDAVSLPSKRITVDWQPDYSD